MELFRRELHIHQDRPNQSSRTKKWEASLEVELCTFGKVSAECDW